MYPDSVGDETSGGSKDFSTGSAKAVKTLHSAAVAADTLPACGLGCGDLKAMTEKRLGLLLILVGCSARDLEYLRQGNELEDASPGMLDGQVENSEVDAGGARGGRDGSADSSLTDGIRPDGSVPETSTPEGSRPETSTPDTNAAEDSPADIADVVMTPDGPRVVVPWTCGSVVYDAAVDGSADSGTGSADAAVAETGGNTEPLVSQRYTFEDSVVEPWKALAYIDKQANWYDPQIDSTRACPGARSLRVDGTYHEFYVNIWLSTMDLRGHRLSANVYLESGDDVVVTPYAKSGSSYVIGAAETWAFTLDEPSHTVELWFDKDKTTSPETSANYDPTQINELGFRFRSRAGAVVNLDDIRF
jgi:hypothetical protein